MNEQEMMINLSLPVIAVNKILQVLGTAPFVEVAALINEIKSQGENQVNQMAAAQAQTPAE